MTTINTVTPRLADAQSIERAKREVVERYGPWTSHRIHIAHGVYTMEPRGQAGYPKRQVMQSIADIAGGDWSKLRILDLACLEGSFAIEAARHGSHAVGIEGREANLAKARFVKDVLGLDNLELYQDDVRNLSTAKYGQFDFVICHGILYHLNAPDVFRFVEQMAEVCTRATIFGTRVSRFPVESRDFDGNSYWGIEVREHLEGSSRQTREKANWKSLDNTTSFMLTRPSLYNLIMRAGFSSLYEYRAPFIPGRSKWARLLAIKGQPQQIISAPWMDESAENVFSERGYVAGNVAGRLQKLAAYLPDRVRHYLSDAV